MTVNRLLSLAHPPINYYHPLLQKVGAIHWSSFIRPLNLLLSHWVLFIRPVYSFLSPTRFCSLRSMNPFTWHIRTPFVVMHSSKFILTLQPLPLFKNVAPISQAWWLMLIGIVVNHTQYWLVNTWRKKIFKLQIPILIWPFLFFLSQKLEP